MILFKDKDDLLDFGLFDEAHILHLQQLILPGNIHLELSQNNSQSSLGMSMVWNKKRSIFFLHYYDNVLGSWGARNRKGVNGGRRL